MPAHSKRDGEFEFARRASNRRLINGCFETGEINPMEGTTTGERMWTAYDRETNERRKPSEMAGENSLEFGASGLPIGQAVLVVQRGREMSGNVCRSSRFSSFVDIPLNGHSETVVTAARRDIQVVEDAEFQRIERKVDPVREAEEVTEAYRKRDVLVIDIPNETHFEKQEHNDTEESMAAAVLTSLSLSPVLPTFTLPYGDWDAFEDDVIDTGETMSVTEPEEKEENRRRKSRRHKNSFKTLYQCTWPGCGKVFTNSSSIIRHVRLSHLGPKNHDDDGFSDGEEEFYFNEIEQNPDENNPRSSQGSISPPPLPSTNHRRGRSMSDPSRPTQPLVSSKSTHLHVDDNFTWPLRGTAGGGRAKIKRSLHPTVHANLRKGRGDGRKCRKVYGMENKHLWCTQCRWKKACIKFVD